MITRFTLNLATAALPNMVFDPNGTAGDTVAKDFTVDTNPGVGAVGRGLSGPRGTGGYDTLAVTFTDFGPQKTFKFSIDIDPLSARGLPTPGPGELGSVSGLELSGATVTVQFSDGTQQTLPLYRGPGATLGGGRTVLRVGAPGAPSISLLPVSGKGTPSQTVRVSGPVGAKVSLLALEAAQFKGNNGYVFASNEANSVVKVTEQDAVVTSTGYIDLKVSTSPSTKVAPTFLYLTAVVRDASGQPGAVSNVIVVSTK